MLHKISSIASKYISTAANNNFNKDIFANKIKSEGLGFINNADLDKKKVAKLANKTELKAEQDVIAKLQPFD